MANWQSIDELQDIASDLPRFTAVWGWISLRCLPITFPCVAIKTSPLNAGVAGLNSAASFCQKI